MKKMTLKKGRDYQILKKHQWIFSGAVEQSDKFQNGEILQVYNDQNKLLGHAYANNYSDIIARMVNFSNEDPLTSLKTSIINAINLRKTLFNNDTTNCYRLINGEGDFVPGIIVDRYNDVLVLQSSTHGSDKLKDFVLKTIKGNVNFKIESIYEKSKNSSRNKEHLDSIEQFIEGKKAKTQIIENNIKFEVDILDAQKTGFFLDMREMRRLTGSMSNNLNVLNCFSYTGGFSLYAALNNAKQVDSIDSSESAIKNAKINFELNGLQNGIDNKYKFYSEDVFNFLNRSNLKDYDLIILDPPAFAKKKADFESAKKAYYSLNKLVAEKAKKGTILVTCSCSYYMDIKSFMEAVSSGIADAGKTASITHKHVHAPDHTLSIHQNEFDYLKSLILIIN